MIPMILIVWAIDVFYRFMQCSAHPEWSAPCSIIRMFAAIYGFFLILVIILAIISIKKLRTVKKQIAEEFNETINNHIQEQIDEVKETKPKKIIVKKDKKSEKKIVHKKTTAKKTDSKNNTKK